MSGDVVRPESLLTLPIQTRGEKTLTVQCDMETKETSIGTLATKYLPNLTPAEVRCIVYALEIALENMGERR